MCDPSLPGPHPLHWAHAVTVAVYERRQLYAVWPQAAGTVSRQVADKVHQDRLASSVSAEHSGRILRCHWCDSSHVLADSDNHVPAVYLAALHRQSVTAVALSADDQTVYSTSKDGSIFITDVETGTRCVCCIGPYFAPGVCAHVLVACLFAVQVPWPACAHQGKAPSDNSCCSLLTEGG